MATPVTPLMSLMKYCESGCAFRLLAFCRRPGCRVAAVLMRVSRWRQEDRNTHLGSAGRKGASAET